MINKKEKIKLKKQKNTPLYGNIKISVETNIQTTLIAIAFSMFFIFSETVTATLTNKILYSLLSVIFVYLFICLFVWVMVFISRYTIGHETNNYLYKNKEINHPLLQKVTILIYYHSCLHYREIKALAFV